MDPHVRWLEVELKVLRKRCKQQEKEIAALRKMLGSLPATPESLKETLEDALLAVDSVDKALQSAARSQEQLIGVMLERDEAREELRVLKQEA